MTHRRTPSKSERGGLPARRPQIVITPSRAKPFAVDCRELPGWFCIPQLGERCVWSTYDPPDWRITGFTRIEVVRPARVHDIEGVEIEEESIDWEPQKGWTKMSWQIFARLTEKTVGWLGTSRIVDGKRILNTFLDEGFDRDWGRSGRLLKDVGRVTTAADGSCALTVPPGETGELNLGAGMSRVRVAERGFTCLRSIELRRSSAKDKASLERSILAESFYTRSGRLVLFRRYNGRLWQVEKKDSLYGGKPWDRRFADHARLVVNGAVFVHWYDCLTDAGLGWRTPPRNSRQRS